MRPERIEEQLGALNRRLAALPEAEQPPATTLQVLGRATQERDWQRLLFHLLNPDGAHGLGRDLLEHVLVDLSGQEELDFSFSRLDLDSVAVAQEVSTQQGRPDGMIWSAENWFVLFELKVGAAEGDDQTERYATIDTIGGIDLDVSAIDRERRHYVYLAPGAAAEPTHDAFVHVPWEWVADELQSFLAASYGAYPTRTTAQIEDFVDTIRSELTMTDYQRNQGEKMALYVRYSEAIAEVEAAFEDAWDDFEDAWGDKLAAAIDDGGTVPAPKVPDAFAVFAFEDREDNRWIFRQTHSDWAWIFKDGWWRHAETGEYVYDYDPSRPDTRVGFLHRLGKHRQDAVQDGELKFFFRSTPPNVDTFSEAFVSRFIDDPEERIQKAKPDRIARTGNTQTLLEGTYEIDTASNGDFLDAYIDALAEAFLDNVMAHSELVTVIDEYYEEAFAAINLEP